MFSYSTLNVFYHCHLECLLYNFDSFCPILFKFTPHHNHQTVYAWQDNWGWRVSITRVRPLCNSYNKMFVLWLIVHVHILWNQFLLDSLNILYCLFIKWVGLQVLSPLVTAHPTPYNIYDHEFVVREFLLPPKIAWYPTFHELHMVFASM